MIAPAAARLLLAAAVLGSPALAGAAEPRTATPAAVADVIACTGVAEAAARLACLDKAAAALKAATETGEIVTLDRREVNRSERENFGRARPAPAPGAPKPAAEQTFEVAQAALGGDHHWLIVLKGGGAWQVVDQTFFSREPKAGSRARISHGALGSYFIEIDGQTGVRAKRID